MYPESSALRDSFHIESHVALLQRRAAAESLSRPLDGVIIPTIRPEWLQPAADLASELDCTLVALCSTEEQARHVQSRQLPGNVFVSYVSPAIDMSQFHFQTSKHAKSDPKSANADIARKRNMGLLLARMCGWRGIMYLDDDIRGFTASAVASAAALLSNFQAVGFEVEHFPDNSVVCHAHRLAGSEQGVFPGGSALLVDASRTDSVFPPIYNEDWLFMFDAVQSRSVAVAGKLAQLVYRPFARPRRAASEEFGDLIAEGLFRLVHERATAADATVDYWEAALRRRAQLIDDITTRLRRRSADQVVIEDDRTIIESALRSLAAARKQLKTINAATCWSFVRDWQSDLESWRSRLPSYPVLGDIRDAAKFLDLPVIDAKGTQ